LTLHPDLFTYYTLPTVPYVRVVPFPDWKVGDHFS